MLINNPNSLHGVIILLSLFSQLLQIINIMRSSSVKKTPRENNQFLETPRSNRQNIKQKQKLSEDIKAKYIQELEQRNRKLKYEIIKINQMLDEQKEKTTAKKQYKLITIQSTSEGIKKELENVYKQIKNYEREINHLESKQAGGMITDKMSRLENILKQKSKHLDKLKAELSTLTKTSLQNSKKLKNNAGKQELENAMLKYNEEIKVMRQKVREAENKQKKKSDNAKKQFNYIKNLQNQLIQGGIAIQQLQQLKKNNIFNQIYDKMNGQKSQNPIGKSQVKASEKEEVEDMTVDRFMELKNEVKLYKKLQLDYDKRLQVLDKEKTQEQKQTTTIKSKLQEKQQEIVKLQEEIGELKAKIKKVNIKPNFSSLTKMETGQKQATKQKPKMVAVKLKSASVTKSITDQTHIKYDQKGQATDKGSRFTDRTIIGKVTDVKIIGVKVWTQKNTFAINGIQCTYKIGDTIKSGQQHINKEAKKFCAQNVMQLADGDYIRAISGHLSHGNVIEYLVFISKNSVIGRMGVAKQTQKQFNYDIDEDEIPICMYGSISNTKQNKQEGSIVENLGFQITRDKTSNKQDKYV